MRALASIAACLAISGIASAQIWTDDFNRPDGPLGPDWTIVSGSWAVLNNQGTHNSSGVNEIAQHNAATGTYDTITGYLDVHAPGSLSQFSALMFGLGGNATIMVKIQDQVSGTPGFSNIGIYYRSTPTGSFGAWTGTGTGFAALQAPFTDGRMKVYFSDPDTIQVEIDTNFDGNPDQLYSKTGVLAFAANLGTSYGLAAWQSTSLFDNFRIESGSGGPPIVNYCTAGTSTNGCAATITADNQPSLTQANPCNVSVSNVEGQKSGLIFYGVDNTGFSGTPWGAGGTSFLCVKAPTQRTTTQGTGGTAAACDGTLALDWNAYQLSHPAALGNPWSLGAKVYLQGWYRDPPAVKTTNLSDGLELTYVP
jgi:hypothetical protein